MSSIRASRSIHYGWYRYPSRDKRIDGSVARRLEELEKTLLRTNSIR